MSYGSQNAHPPARKISNSNFESSTRSYGSHDGRPGSPGNAASRAAGAQAIRELGRVSPRHRDQLQGSFQEQYADDAEQHGELRRDAALTRVLAAPTQLRRGDTITQALCFVGGGLLVADGVYFLVSFLEAPSAALVTLRVLLGLEFVVLGAGVMGYECPVHPPPQLIERLRDAADAQCKVLSTAHGRGILYAVLGLLIVVGCGVCTAVGASGMYVLLCGAVLLIRAFMVRRSIDKLKAQLAATYSQHLDELQDRWYACDHDRVGLDPPTLWRFFKELEPNAQLSEQEASVMFLELDRDNSGLIDYEEFIAWYSARGATSGGISERDWLTLPAQLYLRYPLFLTVRLLNKIGWKGAGIAAAVTCSVLLLLFLIALAYLKPPMAPSFFISAGTHPMGMLWHILMGVLLVVVHHMMLAAYAKSQYDAFAGRHPLPAAPALYVWLSNRFFDMVREVTFYAAPALLAADENNIGASVELFAAQETILIIAQLVCAAALLSRWRHTSRDLKGVRRTVLAQGGVDVAKTAAVIVLSMFYEPNSFAEFFNRLPWYGQMSFYLLVHSVLGSIHHLLGLYSLSIARLVASRNATAESQAMLLDADGWAHDPADAQGPLGSFSVWNVVSVDGFWYANALGREGAEADRWTDAHVARDSEDGEDPPANGARSNLRNSFPATADGVEDDVAQRVMESVDDVRQHYAEYAPSLSATRDAFVGLLLLLVLSLFLLWARDSLACGVDLL